MNCKLFQSRLPDLMAEASLDPAPEAMLHLAACARCRHELSTMRQTIDLLDLWAAPEPSPYFDQKLAVLLREEMTRPKLGWLAQLRERLLLNTGPQFRPAIAGALGVALLVGGGSFLRIATLGHTGSVQASATVNDLQIIDKNDVAIQQMDQLIDDDQSGHSAAPDQPAS